MAEATERSYGAFATGKDSWDGVDQYGTKFSAQIAVNNGDGTWTWHDVSDDVRGLEWDRGAADPLTQPTVGTATITVNNRTSLYSPWNTTVGIFAGGSHSTIVPGTPARIGCTQWDPDDHSSISWFPLFSGRVESATESTVDNTDSYVSFQLVDVTASLAAHGHGVAMGGGPGALHAWAIGNAVVLPVVVVASTNDQFLLNSDTYTIAAGTYSSIFTLRSAVANATKSGGAHFSDVVTVSVAHDALLFTLVATGASSDVLHFGGLRDVLTYLGSFDGQQFSTYEDPYYGNPGVVMLPGLLTDIDFAFAFIDGVVAIDALDPFWTDALLQSPDRSRNRLVAAQEIATACNCMVYGSSSGAIIVARFGPAVDGSPDFGTFTNNPTGAAHVYPIVDIVSYASTDRILNIVTGQRAQPTGPTYWRTTT